VGKYGVFPLVIYVLYCTGFDICASLGADIRATCQQMQYYSFFVYGRNEDFSGIIR